jgi:Tfp pilus assembly protein PilF
VAEKRKNVPILAAAYNMLGVIQMEAKDYSNATKLFSKAMEVFPDFIGAYQNLEELKKRDKNATKPKPVKPKNG